MVTVHSARQAQLGQLYVPIPWGVRCPTNKQVHFQGLCERLQGEVWIIFERGSRAAIPSFHTGHFESVDIPCGSSAKNLILSIYYYYSYFLPQNCSKLTSCVLELFAGSSTTSASVFRLRTTLKEVSWLKVWKMEPQNVQFIAHVRRSSPISASRNTSSRILMVFHP